MAALEQAVSTMAHLRLETDTLDNLMDGLAEQIDESQLMQETLGGSLTEAQIDEEELLAELGALNLDDDTAVRSSGAGNTGGAELPPVPNNASNGPEKSTAQSVREEEADTTKLPAALL